MILSSDDEDQEGAAADGTKPTDAESMEQPTLGASPSGFDVPTKAESEKDEQKVSRKYRMEDSVSEATVSLRAVPVETRTVGGS